MKLELLKSKLNQLAIKLEPKLENDDFELQQNIFQFSIFPDSLEPNCLSK